MFLPLGCLGLCGGVHHTHFLVVKCLDVLRHLILLVHFDAMVLLKCIELACKLVVQLNRRRTGLSDTLSLVFQAIVQQLQLFFSRFCLYFVVSFF